MNINKKNKLKAGVLAALMVTTFAGCKKREMAAYEDYDIVGQINNEDGTVDIGSGLHQSLKVPGEKFTLETDYSFDDTSKREWRITSDKTLYCKVNTKGLPDDTEVYIDNVHIDSSIKAKYTSMNGILQDSMDDRIHNSLMLGFPIGDDIDYYNVFAVEGCNMEFIEGSGCGFNGYYSSTITQKRYTEKDYLDAGVWGSKFQIVYDLLIKTPNDKTPRCVSVKTDFVVPVNNEIVYSDGNSQTKVYKYNNSNK